MQIYTLRSLSKYIIDLSNCVLHTSLTTTKSATVRKFKQGPLWKKKKYKQGEAGQRMQNLRGTLIGKTKDTWMSYTFRIPK